ncbi:hypothetical protein [Kitasatospora purpeofusca]|uniref:hypothetical protein n=1 Tax=Kitasatospora purpeofusca TaxID=67352 RepID=UPI003F4A89AD
MRRGREHLLDVGRIHAAFVADARERGEACGPLDLLPAPELPAKGGGVYRPAAELAYTVGTGEERHRLRAACAALWEQAGPGGRGRSWERRWRAFPRLLVVLVGPAAAGARPVRERTCAWPPRRTRPAPRCWPPSRPAPPASRTSSSTARPHPSGARSAVAGGPAAGRSWRPSGRPESGSSCDSARQGGSFQQVRSTF